MIIVITFIATIAYTVIDAYANDEDNKDNANIDESSAIEEASEFTDYGRYVSLIVILNHNCS